MKALFCQVAPEAASLIKALLDKRPSHVLVAEDLQEARQLLGFHGETLDLVVTKSTDEGLALVHSIKENAEFDSIAILLLTVDWTDEDCARHQDSADGANGYFKLPLHSGNLRDLEIMLGAIFGDEATAAQTLAHNLAVTAAEGSDRSLEIELEMTGAGGSLERAASPSPPQPPPQSQPPTMMANSDVATTVRPNPVGKSAAPVVGPQAEISRPDAPPAVPSVPSVEDQRSAILEGLPDVRQGTSIVAPKTEFPAVPEKPEFLLDDESDDEPENAGNEPIQLIPPPEHQTGIIPTAHFELVERSVPPPPSTEELAADPEIPSIETSNERKGLPFGGSGNQRPGEPQILHPVGDAVVPGGASTSPDLETLKRYLELREQDVAALSLKLRDEMARSDRLTEDLRMEVARTELAQTEIERLRTQLADRDEAAQLRDKNREDEFQQLKFQNQVKGDRVRILEAKLATSVDEIEKIKERVRLDIRKIRTREKELENRIEIIKRDSEALIASRETKIIELKRKLDLLEFNLDLLQNRYNKERDASAELKLKLEKAAQVVRVAEGLLGSPQTSGAYDEKDHDQQAHETEKGAGHSSRGSKLSAIG